MEDAVTAHRNKYLLILAQTWGLEYSHLKQPDHNIQQKQKVLIDGSNLKRVRARENIEGNNKVELIILLDNNGEVRRQDRIT